MGWTESEPQITDRVEGRILGGVPFEFDLLAGELSRRIPGFGEGNPISWGVLIGAINNAWREEHRIEGLDWRAITLPPGSFSVPTYEHGSVVGERLIDRPSVMFLVHTGELDIDAARDAGRKRLWALVGLMRRELPVLRIGDVLWEGAMTQLPGGNLKLTLAQANLAAASPLEKHGAELEDVRKRFAPLQFSQIPGHVQRSLNFLAKARANENRSDVFFQIWLSIIALVSFRQPRRASDGARIRAFTERMTFGVAGVLSPATVGQLNARLYNAIDVRDALFHRDDESGLTDDFLNVLESTAFELIDFELASLGIKKKAAPH